MQLKQTLTNVLFWAGLHLFDRIYLELFLKRRRKLMKIDIATLLKVNSFYFSRLEFQEHMLCTYIHDTYYDITSHWLVLNKSSNRTYIHFNSEIWFYLQNQQYLQRFFAKKIARWYLQRWYFISYEITPLSFYSHFAFIKVKTQSNLPLFQTLLIKAVL